MLVYCSLCVCNLFIRAGNRGRWPASVKLVTLPISWKDRSKGHLTAADNRCCLCNNLLQNDAGETSSVGSQDTIISASEYSTPSKQRPLQKGLRYAQHGSVLRHVILKMASAQLVSAADRVDAGMPTAVAAAVVVAVGTSHGVVVVFDSRQTLRWCLGGAGGIGTEFGAVSALACVSIQKY